MIAYFETLYILPAYVYDKVNIWTEIGSRLEVCDSFDYAVIDTESRFEKVFAVSGNCRTFYFYSAL